MYLYFPIEKWFDVKFNVKDVYLEIKLKKEEK